MKAIRKIVYEKFGGKCAYCGCDLDDKWQVDHAVSKQYWFFIDPKNMKAVNNIENLYPACQVWKHYKRALCLDASIYSTGFRNYMSKFHIRLAKLPKKTKREKTLKTIAYMNAIADKYGITPDKPFSGLFYFETI